MISSHLYINRYRASSQKDAFVEDYWNVLKGALLQVTGRRPTIKTHGGGIIILVIVLRVSASLSAGGQHSVTHVEKMD